MAKSQGIDDIIKAIMKVASTKAGKKARYDVLKGSGLLGMPKGASSDLKAIKGAVRKSKQAKTKAPAKTKSGLATPGSGGKTTKQGRISKTAPERRKRDVYDRNKTIPQNDAERRAATRDANYYLRRSGSGASDSRRGGVEPTDVRGSIIKPPRNSSMRPETPRGSKPYEADPTKRLEGAPSKKKQQRKTKNQPKGTKPNQGTKPTKNAPNTPRSSSRPQGRNMAEEMRRLAKEGKHEELAALVKRLRGK